MFIISYKLFLFIIIIIITIIIIFKNVYGVFYYSFIVFIKTYVCSSAPVFVIHLFTFCYHYFLHIVIIIIVIIVINSLIIIICLLINLLLGP